MYWDNFSESNVVRVDESSWSMLGIVYVSNSEEIVRISLSTLGELCFDIVSTQILKSFYDTIFFISKVAFSFNIKNFKINWTPKIIKNLVKTETIS